MGMIVNPATGAPFDPAPQPVWISEEDQPGIRSLVMVGGQPPSVMCLLGVVRERANLSAEYLLPNTGEKGTEADIDAAMQKVMQIIMAYAEEKAQ